MTEPTASAASSLDLGATAAAGGTTSREAAVRLRLGELAGPDPADDHEFFTTH